MARVTLPLSSLRVTTWGPLPAGALAVVVVMVVVAGGVAPVEVAAVLVDVDAVVVVGVEVPAVVLGVELGQPLSATTTAGAVRLAKVRARVLMSVSG